MKAKFVNEKFSEKGDPIKDMGIGYAKEIQALIEGVAAMDPVFFDDPNGPYSMTCPFCSEYIDYGGNRSHPTMQDIQHDKNCIWLIAKKLHKEFDENK